MSSTVGFIKTVAIREVWPTEHADFTPWLQTHIGALDNVLGLGLTNPQREVGAGDFKIDLVAESNVGDVVIELNRAAAAMKHTFEPYIERLNPQLEDADPESSAESPA